MEFINPSPVIGLTARSNRLIRPRTQSTTCHDTSVKEDGGGRRKAVLAAASSGRGGGACPLYRISFLPCSLFLPSDFPAREQLFVASKLGSEDHGNVRAACKKTLAELEAEAARLNAQQQQPSQNRGEALLAQSTFDARALHRHRQL